MKQLSICSQTGMALFAGLFVCVAASGQSSVREMRAHLASGFNTVDGRLITAGDMMIFLDDAQPQSSFYATRAQVDQITTENGDNVVVQFKQAIRDRTGERSRVVFRVPAEDRDALKAWLGRAPSSGGGATQAHSEEFPTYSAQRNKMIGNDDGRLVVKSDRLAFEANNPAASREWLFSDIRSFKYKGPYRIEIQPFSGDKYNLKLLGGGGMSRDDYKRIADSIARARAKR
ncbi:MAG: hypothetical protein LC126_28100 [Bryobacterales bacterium]|nr:hypothetical protein [Bryobacterales bacterium]